MHHTAAKAAITCGISRTVHCAAQCPNPNADTIPFIWLGSQSVGSRRLEASSRRTGVPGTAFRKSHCKDRTRAADVPLPFGHYCESVLQGASPANANHAQIRSIERVPETIDINTHCARTSSFASFTSKRRGQSTRNGMGLVIVPAGGSCLAFCSVT